MVGGVQGGMREGRNHERRSNVAEYHGNDGKREMVHPLRQQRIHESELALLHFDGRRGSDLYKRGFRNGV